VVAAGGSTEGERESQREQREQRFQNLKFLQKNTFPLLWYLNFRTVGEIWSPQMMRTTELSCRKKKKAGGGDNNLKINATLPFVKLHAKPTA